MFNYFSVAPPENSGGAGNSTEKSGPDAKNFFCSMYEMSQRHPVWVAENHVNPCNSEGKAYRLVPLLVLTPLFCAGHWIGQYCTFKLFIVYNGRLLAVYKNSGMHTYSNCKRYSLYVWFAVNVTYIIFVHRANGLKSTGT